jgi:hypothetical protein
VSNKVLIKDLIKGSTTHATAVARVVPENPKPFSFEKGKSQTQNQNQNPFQAFVKARDRDRDALRARVVAWKKSHPTVREYNQYKLRTLRINALTDTYFGGIADDGTLTVLVGDQGKAAEINSHAETILELFILKDPAIKSLVIELV